MGGVFKMASATIQKIIGKEEIPWADKIEIVKILGWQCVVSKYDRISYKIRKGK